ncbi:MAG TPA: amidase family protein, partial [Terriglobales bacterium]|nr:amidase family protein [Terriglobales bacterium]
LAGKRLGVIQPDFSSQGDPEVGQAFAAALDVLRELGAKLEETELPDFPYGPVAVTLYSAEAASIFRPFIESGKVMELLDEFQKAGLIAALSLPAKDYLDAFRVRAQILPALGKLFEKFDALVSPSRITPAPRLDADLTAPPPPRAGAPERPATPPQNLETRNVIGSSNVAGLPAISVPCGFTKEGNLPIGIQFVADALREDVCLEFAIAYQSATDFHRRPPERSVAFSLRSTGQSRRRDGSMPSALVG